MFCNPCARPEQECSTNHPVSRTVIAGYANPSATGKCEYPLPSIRHADGDNCDEVDEDELCQLNKHIGKSAIGINMHGHTFTCAKNGFDATDKDCRMVYPRPTLTESRVDEQTGCIFLRRDHGMLVTYNRFFLAAQPVNHAFYVLAEMSRFLRELEIWQSDKRAGRTTRAMPELPTLEKAAADAALYALKYATKADNSAHNAVLVQAMEALNRSRRYGRAAELNDAVDNPDTSSYARVIRIIRQLCHWANGAQTFSESQCALYLLQLGDHVISHSPVIHDIDLFRQYVAESGNRDPDIETVVEVIGSGSGVVQLSTKLIDYLHRSPLLDMYPPIVMSMFFQKKPQDIIYRRYAFRSFRALNLV